MLAGNLICAWFMKGRIKSQFLTGPGVIYKVNLLPFQLHIHP